MISPFARQETLCLQQRLGIGGVKHEHVGSQIIGYVLAARARRWKGVAQIDGPVALVGRSFTVHLEALKAEVVVHALFIHPVDGGVASNAFWGRCFVVFGANMKAFVVESAMIFSTPVAVLEGLAQRPVVTKGWARVVGLGICEIELEVPLGLKAQEVRECRGEAQVV